MALSLNKCSEPLKLRPATLRPNPALGKTWTRVESVADRFALEFHRRSVRLYLYAVAQDIDSLRRFGGRLLTRGRFKRALRRGRMVLAEARRLYPDEPQWNEWKA